MPLPKQYNALLNAHTSSRLVTFDRECIEDPSMVTAPTISGLTYAQAVELRQKHPEEYRQILGILRDSAFD